MAQDIGTVNLPDDDAVKPPDPTDGREQVDYNIPRPLLATDFNLPKEEQGKGVKIQVRTTTVHDALTGLNQFLSSMVAIENDVNDGAVLAMSIFAHFTGLVGETVRTARAGFDYLEDLNLFLPRGLVQMIITEITDDFFVCTIFDLSTFETAVEDRIQIDVAQPPKFRKTEFDGQTVDGVTYTYTDPGNPHIREATGDVDGEEVTIVEEIIPSYQVGQIIYAMPVMGSPGLPNAARFIEMNVDGRMWAKTGDA